MKKWICFLLLLIFHTCVNGQLKIGDVGYPKSDQKVYNGNNLIDSIMIVPQDSNQRAKSSFYGGDRIVGDNYYHPYSISNENRKIIDNHFDRKMRGAGSSVRIDLGYHIQYKYTNFKWIYAKIFFKRGKKYKAKYVQMRTVEFKQKELSAKLSEIQSIKDSCIIGRVVNDFYVLINEQEAKRLMFNFPRLTNEIISKKAACSYYDAGVIRKEKEATATKKHERLKMKEDLLDAVSNGNANIRNAIASYSPIRGMTLDQIQYMNEINEILPFRYDKFNEETGNGFIYCLKGSSGFDYASARIVVYYFQNHKFMNIYRDLATVRKIHGKFEIY